MLLIQYIKSTTRTYSRQSITFLTFLVVLASCTAKKENQQVKLEEPPATNLSGEQLAISHCSRCHAFVSPKLLSKTIWEKHVLPSMGNRLGIYTSGFRSDSLFSPGESGITARQANVFPEQPVIAKSDWKKIIQYYIDNAPDTIPSPIRKGKIRIGLEHFKYKEALFAHRPALTSMVKILPNKQGLAFSDGKGRMSVLTFLSPQLQEIYTMPLETTPIQLQESAGATYLTTIGKGVFPNDATDGVMYQLFKNGLGYQLSAPLISDLRRPVFMAYGDLNKDGWEDVVACEFGEHAGQLNWYENNGKGGYTRKLLRDKPGAISAVIKDANKDGLPDIYVLMSQGDEGVFLYENQGNGNFKEKRLLTFLPLNGSQHIELVDFNKDGFDDIVYVCGDNADKTTILKDYHGIYIFLNDGKSNFKQSYFYQLNGAYKTIVADYDKDGDLDIAAISFFPDYVRSPEESFIYLKNKGNMKFDDYSFPQAPNGRWVVMDAGDIDGDGDIDLALGSFVYFIPKGDTTGLGKKWMEKGPSVILLENTIR